MSISLRRVLITEDVAKVGVDILRKNGIEVDVKTDLAKNPEKLKSELANYDGLIIRSATKVTADILNNAGSRLRIIGRAGTGVDNIDCDAATRKGVIVMNTPGGNTLSAAEHTCAMVMSLSRHIPQAHESMRAGRWDRKLYMGNEVFGKTLAIIGLGRIGKEVATRMQGFGMTTIGYDPIIPGEVSSQFGVEWLPLEEIWKRADYITVHTPLIPQTKHLINADVLSRCKKGVKLVNVARGGIIDEDAIVPAIEAGHCGGAGLDVFVEEPTKNKSLYEHPKVICTPHLGASTREGQDRCGEEIGQQFVDVNNGVSLFGAINAQALTNALSAETKPWVNCAKGLGVVAASLLNQVNNKTKLQIHTTNLGDARAASFIKSAVLAGVLSLQVNGNLNLVNSPVFAQDLGIDVTQTAEAKSDSTLVKLSASNDGGASFTLTGCANGELSLLKTIDGATFASGANLSGKMLIYKAQDNPQVMPAVASALAAENVSALSFSATQPVEGQTWNVMHISAKLENLDILKLHVTSAYQASI